MTGLSYTRGTRYFSNEELLKDRQEYRRVLINRINEYEKKLNETEAEIKKIKAEIIDLGMQK